jgi:hypothetical protein
VKADSTTARAETAFERSADEVWSRIGRFEDLTWFPGFEWIALEGGRRTVATRGVEAQMVEQLLELDDDRRTLTYSVVSVVGAVEGTSTTIRLDGGAVVDMAPVVGHHRASIAVVSTGPDTSSATYDVTLDSGDAAMLTALAHGYQAALDHAKVLIES